MLSCRSQKKGVEGMTIVDHFVALYTSGHNTFVRRWMRPCERNQSRPAPAREVDPQQEVSAAERALAAFRSAVAKQYGVVEAARATQDWIEELEKVNGDAGVDWRAVTIAAAARLARRVTAPVQVSRN